MGKTLYQKVYDSHIVFEQEGELPTLYIDRQLVHEVTSPQAFAGIEAAGRKLRRPDLHLATMDHDISTKEQTIEACSPMAQEQIKALMSNTKKFGVKFFGFGELNQGIVHVVGPQTGFTLPGTTLVCGDSHTATHGAFGALAFGIGTSEVEHVLATQTIKQARLKNMKIEVNGVLPEGLSAKDIILAICTKLGTAGGTGYAVEFTGSAIKALSMEGRMTLSNMAIEMGAKVGMIAPDEVTFNYLKDRPFAPKGKLWDEAVEYWKTLKSDDDAKFDAVVTLNASELKPMVTWGTNPGQGMFITDLIPAPSDFTDEIEKASCEKALAYMDLKPHTKITDVAIDKVFIGSCTNGRIEDMRAAAAVIKGRKVAKTVTAIVVPGSQEVKEIAEKEGLDKIFLEAGFEWRLPGCSMCLAMNSDKVPQGERCASTSNRNFEGRQGRGSRTHLVSPAMAAAAAIAGHLVDIREF